MTFDEWMADKPKMDHGTTEWMREAFDAATTIEREACAKICEESGREVVRAEWCARAIRRRSDK